MTKAAADLSVAQPVLSRQIRELEAELGVALLSRNGRGVALTEAGERFLVRARGISRDADSAREEVRSLRSRPSGTVSVAMAPSAGAILWAPLVALIQRDFPDIRLQLSEGYSGYVVEWLMAGKADVGVIYQPQQSTQVKHELLLTEQLYLVGASDSDVLRTPTIEFEHLGALPLILPGVPHAIRRLLESLAAKHHITLRVQLEVNAYPAIKNLVVARRGLTVLPIAPVLPELHAGQLTVAEIVSPTLSQRVGLATSSHHPASIAARAVCRAISALVQELVATGRWPARYAAQHEN